MGARLSVMVELTSDSRKPFVEPLPDPDGGLFGKSGLAASVGTHFLAFAALAPLVAPPQVQPPPVRAVVVEVLSGPAFEALIRAPAPGDGAVELRSESEPITPAEGRSAVADTNFVTATTFRAADILANPANTEVRNAFPTLATSEQIIQLCNIEAVEQLRIAEVAANPDVVVGYAYAPFEVAGLSLSSDGGAFRSDGNWFRLRYRCTVKEDMTAVTRFEYAIGDPVPEEEWDAHYLNADDDWLTRIE